MDNVTHTLFALTLARTRIGRGGRGTTMALVLGSNAPDIDIVAALGGSANYLAWHRGPTHGPLGIVGLGLITASLVWVGPRSWGQSARSRLAAACLAEVQSADAAGGQARRPSPTLRPGKPEATFMSLLAASLVGVLFHILMDLPTSYGTRLLSPFSWRWYAIDLLPIIDS